MKNISSLLVHQSSKDTDAMGSDSTSSFRGKLHQDGASISSSSRQEQSLSSDTLSAGSFSKSTSTHSGTGTDQDLYEYVGGRRGTGVLNSAKMMVLASLVILAGITSWLWWKYATSYEQTLYRNEFQQFAGKVAQVFLDRVEYRTVATASLATSLSTQGLDKSSTSWPFVSFTNFERRVAASRKLCSATAVWFSPTVEFTQRNEWEEYARDYKRNATEDQFDTTDYYPYRLPGWSIDQGMYRIENNEAVSQNNSLAEHYPIWQTSPTGITSPFDDGIAMFDQPSEGFRERALASMKLVGTTIFSETQMDATSTSLVEGYEDGPHVSLYSPLFHDVSDSNSAVVGTLTMDISWNSFFDDSLDSPGGVLVVLDSTCGQNYTFEVRVEGSTFHGRGVVVYNNKLDLSLSSSFEEFGALLGLDSEDSSTCLYRIHIFPTKAFEEEFLTDAPKFSAIAMGAIYIITAAVFVIYDNVIQARQDKVLQSAKRSTAIIKSLFPAQFRSRLLDEKRNRKFESMLPENFSPLETHKMRLQNFLAPTGIGNLKGKNSRNQNAASGIVGSEPIAEFFTATSIMFADLSGFTAWSSTREPAQVFTLLETLYGAMDKAARRLGVFKVETVGDCYVAATGIPDPRPDHAVLMAKFANTCLAEIKELTGSLESLLGPGTGDLAFRIGIHSGPVTAGVLRGEKSRFQLFGDTMNTASRMESSGEAGRVHVSKETADLLIAAGREDMLEETKNIVTAKGKGEVVTYWLKPSARKVNRGSVRGRRSVEKGQLWEDDSSSMSFGADASVRSSTGSLHTRKYDADSDRLGKIDRLVDYNAEVMISLLKKIVARRSVVQDVKDVEYSVGGSIAMDEVREVIRMPEYNQEAAIKMASDYTVEIPNAVRTELREYIRRIAHMYQDNSFHNFEHASHVALSANKLLKRIVMPEEVDYRRSGQENVVEKMLAVSRDLHEHTLGISSDPVAQFAVVFAALVHDVDHPGVPNGILAKEEPDVAEKYRHKSIAEQRSIEISWDILMEEGFSALRQCMFPSQTELKHFRQLVVNTVLATDIFDKELSQLRKARWQKCFHPEEAPSQEEDKKDAFSRKATIVIEHIIQASDVAHTMQHWHVYQKWNERLFVEMYKAYQDGRSQTDPSEGWYKGELWFFDNYVIPLAHKLKECGVFGVSSAEYLQYARENRDEWERKGRDVCKRMMAQCDEEQSFHSRE